MARKWRRKALKSLKTDSEMAAVGAVTAEENRSGEFGITPAGRRPRQGASP
jgi:hypothetical protein